MSAAASKRKIRVAIQDSLALLSSGEKERKSRKLAEQFLAHEGYKNKTIIGLYYSRKNEPGTIRIIQQALMDKKIVALPAIENDRIIFRKISSIGELVIGKFKIKSPPPTALLVPIEAIELILVPGIAFDQEGSRIGQGLGYYDILLQSYQGEKVAIAFGVQLVDRFRSDPWDIKIDQVISC